MEIDGEKITITIQEVENYLKDVPITNILVEDIANMCIHKDKKDKETYNRAMSSNLDYPIIISQSNGNYEMILDGHHRLQKSININKKYIGAKILNLDIASNIYQKMFK
jgi:hypothetical protein